MGPVYVSGCNSLLYVDVRSNWVLFTKIHVVRTVTHMRTLHLLPPVSLDLGARVRDFWGRGMPSRHMSSRVAFVQTHSCMKCTYPCTLIKFYENIIINTKYQIAFLS